MNDVFISYSRQNKAFMTRLNNALSEQGLTVWVDWEDIPKGEDWLQAIYNGIEEAHKFVCIVSPDWLVSEICHQEMTYAREHNKPIIPVMYKESSIELVGGFWYDKSWEQDARANWTTLNHLNWQFFREEDDFDTALTELIEVLQSDFDHVRIHTRLLTQARDWQKAEHATTRLLRGDDLTDAEAWLITNADKQPMPTNLMQDYIRASRQLAEDLVAEEIRRKEQIRRLRIGAAIPAMVGIIATIIAIWAGLDAREAIQKQAAAQAIMTQANTELQNVRLDVQVAETNIAHADLTLVAVNILSEAQAAYTEGIDYLELGEFAKAQTAFEEALGLKPDYASAYYGLGLTLFELDEIDQAQAAFEQALVAYRVTDNRAGIANTLYYLAVLTENSERTVALAEEALAVLQEMSNPNMEDINELESIIQEIRSEDN